MAKKQERTWKRIPGFEGEYEMDDDGRVRDCKFKQLHAPIHNHETGENMIRLGGKRFALAAIKAAVESGKSLKKAAEDKEPKNKDKEPEPQKT